MIQQIEEHITKVDAFTASTLDDVEKFRIEYLGKNTREQTAAFGRINYE